MRIAIAAGAPRALAAGFTLIELLVALGLIGLVLAGILGLLMTGQQTYLIQTNQVEAQQVARLSLERMAREIRDAGVCATCGGGAMTPFPAITNVTATAFTIQNDWNGNWTCPPGAALATCNGIEPGVVVSGRGEQVTYSVVGTVLQRQESAVDNAPQTLADNVAQAGATPLFQYLDRNDVATANPTDVRTIIVSLVARPAFEPSTSAAGRAEVVMTTRIRIRNR